MDFLQNIKPREYQKKILETCIEKNCLVVLPTGLGKTLIALMLAIERMKQFPGEKVVFLAPTRPLAEQHISFFKKNLSDLFGSLELFTGSISPSKRKSTWKTADIIFSTPQCVANDVKKGLYNLEDVCLLIEDEAHRCSKNYDYNYVAQTYKTQSQNPRILGLTASPGSEMEKVKEICKNLSIEAVEIRTRDSPDVSKYLQELEFQKIFVELPKEFFEMKEALTRLFNSYVSELRNRKFLFTFPSKTELIKIQKKIMFNISKGNRNYNTLLASSACAQAIKLQHALELLETQTHESFNTYIHTLFKQAAKKESKGVMRLVSRPEFNYIFMKSNNILSENIEHPKIERLLEVIKSEKEKNPDLKIIIFSQFRDTARLLSKKINQIKDIKAQVFVGQSKKTHSSGEVSGLSQKDQKNVLEEFSLNQTNVLCATSIGEEGLDIPEVNLVIFYEPVPSAIRAIQRAGRTARLMEGKLIMLITRNTRDETHFYVSRAREKKMHTTINSVKNTLSKNIKEDIQKEL